MTWLMRASKSSSSSGLGSALVLGFVGFFFFLTEFGWDIGSLSGSLSVSSFSLIDFSGNSVLDVVSF